MEPTGDRHWRWFLHQQRWRVRQMLAQGERRIRLARLEAADDGAPDVTVRDYRTPEGRACR